jgi:GT2 family glycosyltransferase/glycosyltransferase involved in cell wall biosynthesis
MKIGIATSHLYGMGGGFQAVKWHILALKKLGHNVTVYTRNTVSQGILQNWFDGVALRQYAPGCEKEYDAFINIDHFAQALPLAKLNLAHVFFPMESTPPPPPETKLYSNSVYTARYVNRFWRREAEVMYIPIDNHFYMREKEKIILHVSRFTKSTVWADKGHRQMIQVFKSIARKMPEWKFVIAGSVDQYMDIYVAELARMCSDYNIDLMPNQSNQSLADLYARSAIYWHATGVEKSNIPSAQEHMGITPMEAQASGCVPIAYNSGGIPEIIVDKQTGILFENIADLGDITMALSGNLVAWSQLSQGGQVWMKTRRDFDAFAGRIDDMLNERPIAPIPPLQMDLNNSPADVTIVIPTYNSPLLQQCINSLRATAPTASVLIVNNGDPLTNLEVYDKVGVFEVGQNLGFAGAHRLASQVVRSKLVLLLNDDIVADRGGWLEQLLYVMNNEEVGVVGPKLYFPDGRLQFAGGLIDFNRIDIGYHRAYGQPDSLAYSTPIETDFVTGAALLCRAEFYKMPDYLMEGLNMEDVDICLTARAQGKKVIYQPASSLVHFEGETKRRTSEALEKVDHNRAEFRKRWSAA